LSVAEYFRIAVRDAGGDGSACLTGSFNWTRAAVLSNHENVVLSNDPAVVEQFTAEFNKLWAANV
jgi:cardiolipin hydrolase